jgi:hypothetical protein
MLSSCDSSSCNLSSHSSALRNKNCSNNQLAWFEHFHFLSWAVEISKKVLTNRNLSYCTLSSCIIPISVSINKCQNRNVFWHTAVTLLEIDTISNCFKSESSFERAFLGSSDDRKWNRWPIDAEKPSRENSTSKQLNKQFRTIQKNLCYLKN